MQGYTATSYGDGFADVYDEWYTDVSDVDATVDAVVALADGGAVLELGVGTGRLALPLAERGVAVTGVDASTAMLDALRAKPGAEDLELIEADMADPGLAGRSYAIAFAAFNTFFNLTNTAAQALCFGAMSGCLRPNGRLAIEGFVPPIDGMPDGGMTVRDITVDRAVLTISQHDSASQLITGQHVDISEAGIRMRPWMMHYRTPDQLDAAARTAGFELETRSADWTGAPFDSQSETHVSVYRLPRDA
jgi:SAM-dependent methyltransferase